MLDHILKKCVCHIDRSGDISNIVFKMHCLRDFANTRCKNSSKLGFNSFNCKIRLRSA